jgi:hypothetical protein
METNISTHFENLPNELMYEIFYYLDALKLYQAFFGLNSRINNILDSIPNISFQPNSIEDANDPFIDRFAQRVVHLTIPRPNFIEATRFPNVHSLEFFDYLSPKQITHVRHKHFRHLVYLRMCYMEDSESKSAFFQMLFSNEFPSLRKCILDEITLPDSNYQWSSSPSLCTLIVSRFSLPAYLYILNFCSNLTHLHWTTIGYADEDIQPIPVQHTQLQRLYFRTINIGNIETILKCVPNLKRLYIVSDWSRGNNCLPLNFQQLARLLIRYVPCLHRFDCDTMERNPVDTDTIRGYHPCFGRIQSERVPDGRTRFFTL